MPSKIVLTSSKVLTDHKLTIAFVESATAGRLCAEYSLIPECGKMLKGGLVCYDACIKQDVLGVPQEVINEYTPESAEVTREIAERLQQLIKADVYVGVTGLTMPGGSETPEKPVGTMFIHAIIKGKPFAIREVYKGDPEQIVLFTVDRVAQLLIDELKPDEI
jgi:nicotinamide-nucleotide amidase